MSTLSTTEWSIRDSLCNEAPPPGPCAQALEGRSVLVATRDPAAAAAALFDLEGIARRLVVCTPDIGAEQRTAIAARASVDVILTDGDQSTVGRSPVGQSSGPTEWVLLTSGTTGVPKMVVHTFATLTAPIAQSAAPPVALGATTGNAAQNIVWGTFYDIRRYGGLQILLRAYLGRARLVLRGHDEPIADYLARLGANGVTHVSGTPSHWRRALMSPNARAIAPRYVRLSGEIADQGILNALRAFYPGARVGHAFASTEAGVGFEINDGLEGFPLDTVGAHLRASRYGGQAPGDVTVDVVDGALRLRSARTALRYLDDEAPIADAHGFVDTGDMVERRGDRYYFLGRRSGLINVGGLKVYPEEVEAAINGHPAVQASLVRSRRSSITGSLVAADVVLKRESDDAAAERRYRQEILQRCREALSPHKIPATIRFVPALDVAATGKVARHA